MFEDYLEDAYAFFLLGQAETAPDRIRIARRYFRASAFSCAAAMEAFVNYIAGSFDQARSLPQYEIDYLNDRVVHFTVDSGPKTRTQFHPVDEKLKLLLKRFVPSFDFASGDWREFRSFKEFRNSLVHSREVEDERDLAEYEAKLKTGLVLIIKLMNSVSVGMFGRPFRQKLLDLTPE